MSKKSRSRTYPAVGDLHEPALTRAEATRQRYLAAAADQWAKEQGADLPDLLGGIVRAVPELFDPMHYRPTPVGADYQDDTFTAWDGKRYALADFDALNERPSFDYVTQGTRRPYPMRTVRVIYRPACIGPCLLSARNERHRCVWEARTYVRRLAPDANGRSRWSTSGYWSDGGGRGTVGSGAYVATTAVVAEREHSSHLNGPGAAVAATYGRTDSVVDVRYRPMVVECESFDLDDGYVPAAWTARTARAHRPTGAARTGRPRSDGRRVTLSRATVARRIAESPEATALAASILAAADLAYRTAEPRHVPLAGHALGLVVYYRPDQDRGSRLVVERLAGPSPDGRDEVLARTSWAQRTTAARAVASQLLAIS